MNDPEKPYIVRAFNMSTIFDGCVDELSFKEGLNILCGANGTGKSRLLSFIAANRDNEANVEKGGDKVQPINLIALSAKRNYIPKNSQQVSQEQRQARKDEKQYVQESKTKPLATNIFQDYTSLAEWLHSAFETHHAPQDATNIGAVEKTVQDANEAFKKVSDEWSIRGQWVDPEAGGRPEYTILRGGAEFPVSELSTGGSELLSIVLTLERAKQDLDVIIIDEPEAHLNWSLEESLFDYLQELSKEVPQIIIATHSQVALYDTYIKYDIFLDRDNDGKVVVVPKLSDSMLKLLTGKAIQLISGSSLSSKKITLFVEDNQHSWLVEAILEKLKIADRYSINIHNYGSGAIVNLYKGLKSNRRSDFVLAKSRFLIDGDNKEQPLSDDDKKYLFQFSAYSAESYFFKDLKKLGKITSKKVSEIKPVIVWSVKKDLLEKFKLVKAGGRPVKDESILKPSRLLLESISSSIFESDYWWTSLSLKYSSRSLGIKNESHYIQLVNSIQKRNLNDFFDGLPNFLCEAVKDGE